MVAASIALKQKQAWRDSSTLTRPGNIAGHPMQPKPTRKADRGPAERLPKGSRTSSRREEGIANVFPIAARLIVRFVVCSFVDFQVRFEVARTCVTSKVDKGRTRDQLLFW